MDQEAPRPPEPPWQWSSGEPPPAPPPPAPLLPWESSEQPLLPSLLSTVQLMLRDGGDAMQRVKRGVGFARPLAYAVLLSWLGAAISAAYQLFLNQSLWRLLPGLSHDTHTEVVARGFALLFTPVAVAASAFVGGGITHLLLVLLGGGRSGYRSTVRVACYANTPAVLSVIPLVGPLVALVWGIYLEVRGLAIAHEMPIGSVLIAVILPAVVCCGCGVWFVASVLGLAILGLGSGG